MATSYSRESPKVEDAVSVRGGGCHELEFDRFAALFESFEIAASIMIG